MGSAQHRRRAPRAQRPRPDGQRGKGYRTDIAGRANRGKRAARAAAETHDPIGVAARSPSTRAAVTRPLAAIVTVAVALRTVGGAARRHADTRWRTAAKPATIWSRVSASGSPLAVLAAVLAVPGCRCVGAPRRRSRSPLPPGPRRPSGAPLPRDSSSMTTARRSPAARLGPASIPASGQAEVCACRAVSVGISRGRSGGAALSCAHAATPSQSPVAAAASEAARTGALERCTGCTATRSCLCAVARVNARTW